MSASFGEAGIDCEGSRQSHPVMKGFDQPRASVWGDGMSQSGKSQNVFCQNRKESERKDSEQNES